MNQYSYICIDGDGQKVEGLLQADNDESARIKLMEQGLKIIRVDLCTNDELFDASKSMADESLEIIDFQEDQPFEFDQAAWNSELDFIDISSKGSHFTVHGLPLSASLRTLAEETSSKKIASEFRKIAVDLEQDTTIEDSLAQRLKKIPDNLESLIRAGIQTDKLEIIIEDYIESQRFLTQSRHKVLTSLFYSIFLILFTFLLFYFLMVVVVSNYKSIFADFGLGLPAITELTFYISDFISQYGLQLVGFLTLISMGVWFSFDLFKMQAFRRQLLNTIPFFGGILSYTSIAQFCRMLATLIEAKIRLPEAIELAAGVTKDPNLIAGCQVLTQRIAKGINIDIVSKEIFHFPRYFASLFRWQDRTEIFIDSLRTSSNIFQAKATAKTGALVFVVQPLVLIGIILIIGVPVLALIIPLFKLLNMYMPYF